MSTVDDGSALDVTAAGMRPGEMCRLVAVDADGGRHPAGVVGGLGGRVTARGGGGPTSTAPTLAAVVLLGDDGRELVRVPF